MLSWCSEVVVIDDLSNNLTLLCNSLLRSEIAWRDAKYAQILEYLREEYEVSQRFGNLNFKVKFVEVLISCFTYVVLHTLLDPFYL